MVANNAEVQESSALRLLKSAFETGRVAHAYLLCGPALSDKEELAYKLAYSMLCESNTSSLGTYEAEGSCAGAPLEDGKNALWGGCESCHACHLARRGTHPDLHILHPEGAFGYLVEQVREVVYDAGLSPLRSRAKVYIVHQCELLNESAANALLKTLEEPPEYSVFILLTSSERDCLPTIVSRAQVIACKPLSREHALRLVKSRVDAKDADINLYLELFGSSIERCGNALRNTQVAALVEYTRNLLFNLEAMSDLEIMQAAKEVAALLQKPLEETRSELEQKSAELSEFLSAAQMKQHEQRHKRRLSAQGMVLKQALVTMIEQYLRDVMIVALALGQDEGAHLSRQSAYKQSLHAEAVYEELSVLLARNNTEPLLIDPANAHHFISLAQRCSISNILRSLEDVASLKGAITYNISFELCIKTTLLNVKDRLFPADASCATRFYYRRER